MKMVREIALVIALGIGAIACDVPTGPPKAPADSVEVSL
jgi:hypothetical protein